MGRFTAGNNADPDRLQRVMNAKQRLIGVRPWLSVPLHRTCTLLLSTSPSVTHTHTPFCAV
jgi:hypothetical protein